MKHKSVWVELDLEKAGETKIIKKFKVHGFECLICVIKGRWYTAYVGVPKTHPFYEKDWEYINEFVDAHGGITYTDYGVLDYEKKNTWWIGIDFAHSWDKCVGRHIKKPTKPFVANPIIWDLKKVEREIRNLARQLKLSLIHI